MPKSRHYPPSHVRYQLENPPVTVHLNRKLHEVLDTARGDKSYAQFIIELLNGTLNVTEQLKKEPTTQLLMKYHNGFLEAFRRYRTSGVCKKCGNDFLPLWADGKCDRCHHLVLAEPTLSNFKKKSSVDVKWYDMVKSGHSSIEKEAYYAGLREGKDIGYELGYSEGFDDALKDYRISYPCSVCGKPIEMRSGDDDHKALIDYMKENGWRHAGCNSTE